MIRFEIVIENRQYLVTAETDEILGRWIRELVEAGRIDPSYNTYCRIVKVDE